MIRDAATIAARQWWAQRLALMSIVAAGFAVLFLAARRFTADLGIIGLSDDAVRVIAHFCVYGTLAVLLAKALFSQYLLAWIVIVPLATGEELHQLFVPYRFCGIGDWAINMTGITVFLLAACYVWPALRDKLAAAH